MQRRGREGGGTMRPPVILSTLAHTGVQTEADPEEEESPNRNDFTINARILNPGP